MKAAFYFALLQFGSSLLFLIIEYNIWPDAYPGESFLIVWFYVFNLFIGVGLLQILFLLLKQIQLKRRSGLILSYFIAVLVTINLIPVLMNPHVFYTFEMIAGILHHSDKYQSLVFELINPLLSFLLAYTVLRKSELWHASA